MRELGPRTPAPDAGTPVLIYDGDCAFCRYWVDYWQALTGPRVRYAPYQRVAAEYPQIAASDFAKAVQFVEADGRVSRAAEASLRALATADGLGFLLWLYRHLPGAQWLAESAYRFIAAHRHRALQASRWLWGPRRVPAQHRLTARLLLDGLALVYVAAFLSMAVQIDGLVGSRGLLPLADYLGAVARAYPGVQHHLLYPTLFWIDASDGSLKLACWGGAAAALLTLWRGGPPWLRDLAYLAAFALWLSIFYAGQVFTDFQWDLLLLEAGFLALAFHRHPTLLVWLVRWLVFRFMLMSGWVKLGGDAAWLDLSALRHYIETQPLPAPLAWPASRLPDGLLSAATVATLAVELLLPFFIALPRRPRALAGACFIAFQLVIAAIGNYGWFNLLVIVLCVGLFDDAAIGSWMPHRRPSRPAAASGAPRRPSAGVIVLAVLVVVLGLLQGIATWRAAPPADAWSRALDALDPLHVVNRYGPFKALPAERVEIVIEASQDGRRWQEIEFPDKPGATARRPGWNLPHQPRLDWQMWFAAMGTQREHPWFARLMLRLLQGSPEVAGLLAPRRAAVPRFVRALAYDYRFAEPGNADWWTRTPLGIYFPAVRLGDAAAGEGDLAPLDGPS